MLTALAVSGYRSLRDVVVPLAGLNLVTGPNGSGKSNLYRALRLLADVAQGRAIASLAQEGGLTSVLWAGPEQIARSVKAGNARPRGRGAKGRQPELGSRRTTSATRSTSDCRSRAERVRPRSRISAKSSGAVRRCGRPRCWSIARARRAIAGRWRLADAHAGSPASTA
jgi:predicted ATPase